MAFDRHRSSDLCQVLQVDHRCRNTHSIAHLVENTAPRIDDHGMAIALSEPAVTVFANLGRRQHVTLILDRSRPQQHVPMIRSRSLRKGCRDGENVGTGYSQISIELGKAQIVAGIGTSDESENSSVAMGSSFFCISLVGIWARNTLGEQ